MASARAASTNEAGKARDCRPDTQSGGFRIEMSDVNELGRVPVAEHEYLAYPERECATR